MDPSPPTVRVVGAAILRRNTCLVVQRGAAMSTPLKWEFPGGKIEAGESPEQALRREIREELALEIEVFELLGQGVVAQPNPTILLDVYLAQITGGSLELREHACARWLEAADLGSVDWAEADRPILPTVTALLTQLP